ncbi:STAS domain-containing protein [Photobacterium sp. CCB-ST2H9]|uniref:STAS domain-containing protein n=1 Tax=Photobacterium sp. CCB-ST2H9 TaxID=2912855 RepID=UPI002006902E|nr:STAS domain-containing protein [Photobacterium sp. CCB-ST2H9]UTM55973.1 STAS domain-containing protein [Photobacterium sp. CCB-ST2H9]
MKLEYIQGKDSQITLVIQGEMDADGCRDIQPYLDQIIAQEKGPEVLIDLNQVPFIDSSGIGAIVYLYKRLREQHCTLSLSQVHGQPLELLKLLRIDQAISINPFVPVTEK